MTDLQSARTVELEHGEQVATRQSPTSDWLLTGEREAYTTRALRGLHKNIRVIETFPITLVDLIPEGCTRFEFENTARTKMHYARFESNDFWSVSDDPLEEIWRLEDIQEQFSAHLETIVPLKVDDRYVEERR